MHPRPGGTRGFTLIEVAFSLAIVVTGILVSLLMLGSSFRQSQLVRDQVLAAAIAARVAESFAHGGDTRFNAHTGSAIGTASETSNPTELKRLASGNREEQDHDFQTPNAIGDLQDFIPYGVSGQFDVEQRLLGPQGFLRPLPSELARRIDSPGDAIRSLLDRGGRIYYVAPDALDLGSPEPGAISTSKMKDGLGRLLVGFVGEAQQNVLPYHPLQRPMSRMYPFPPAFGRAAGSSVVTKTPGMSPRQWRYRSRTTMMRSLAVGASAWAEDIAGPQSLKDSWEGLEGVQSYPVPDWYTAGADPDWRTYFIDAADTATRKQLFMALLGASSGELASYGHDWLVWHWFANNEVPDNKPATWASVWQGGLPHFAAMTVDHWQRLLHQIDIARLTSDPTTTTRTVTERERVQVGVREETVTSMQVRVDANGNETYVPVEQKILVPIYETREVTRTITSSPATIEFRGIPAPPAGVVAAPLITARVPYEDYWPGQILANGEIHVAMSQLRTGLPGLQQRRNYRDAAAGLYAAVAALTGAGAADPLGTELPLPADALTIHPAQVLALSYLAHAAVMTTGYKPPFIARQNTPDTAAWSSLARNDGAGNPLPYRWQTVEEVEFGLGADGVIEVKLAGGMTHTTLGLSTGGLLTALVDMNGVPTSYTGYLPEDLRVVASLAGAGTRARLRFGPVLNPFPPPWADHTPAHAPDPSAPDTAKAKLAVYNLYRWLNAFLAANPYDHIVPRPLNRQTSWDQPLFAKDMFSARPPALAFDLHAVMWPFGQDAVWCPSFMPADPMNTLNGGFASNNPAKRVNPTTGELIDFTASPSGRYSQSGQFQSLALANGYPMANVMGAGGNGAARANFARYRTMTRSPGGEARRFWFTDRDPDTVQNRTRQLVIWSAPWQSYEDFESVPGEAPDISQMAMVDNGRGAGYNFRFRPKSNNFGHPEELVNFANPARDATIFRMPADRHIHALPPDTNFLDRVSGFDNRTDTATYGTAFTNIPYFHHKGPSPRTLIFAQLGMWGADRNGNGAWDRGPISATQRIRASEVGRYVFYDPVLWVPIR